MFGKKMKIEINDNFNMIQNYILSAVEPISFKDLLQYCIDYQLYEDFYVNITVFKILLDEKNLSFKQSDIKKNLL